MVHDMWVLLFGGVVQTLVYISTSLSVSLTVFSLSILSSILMFFFVRSACVIEGAVIINFYTLCLSVCIPTRLSACLF